MILIDEILEALRDGEWHGFFEINTATKISFKQLNMALGFLEKFDFVEKQTGSPLWRAVPSVQEFLKEIKRLE